MNPETIKCKRPTCDTRFSPRTNAHKYCSETCIPTWRAANKGGLRKRVCRPCGREYTMLTLPGSFTKSCSEECHVEQRREAQRARGSSWAPRCRVSFPTCEFCGALFTSRSRSNSVTTCSLLECRRKLKNRQQTEWSARYREKHGITYQHAKYAAQREVYKLRRLEKLSIDWEYIDHAEIFERDEWRCRLCFLPVDPSLVWPDPGSKSLDHITPVSRGGKHIRDNVQLAHLGCNCAKADKSDELQEILAELI